MKKAASVEQFKDVGGIRIEDGYEITETGAQLLGNYLETEFIEIEAVRGMLKDRIP